MGYYNTPQTIGFAHTHPQQYDNIVGGDMFSPADFLRFRDIVNMATHNGNANESDAYGIMMFGTGNERVNYMSKFTGSYANAYNEFTPNAEELKKGYGNYVERYGNAAKAFLTLVNEVILNGDTDFKDSGFHLMKFGLNNDSSLKSSSEISLDQNGKVKKENC